MSSSSRAEPAEPERARAPVLEPPQAFEPPVPELHPLLTAQGEPASPERQLWSLPDGGELMHCTVLLRHGALHEPMHRAGLWPLLADLLDEGTKARPGDHLTRDIEALGGELDTGSGWQSSWLQISGLARHAETLLARLQEALLEPEFSPAALERERQARLAALSRMEKSPGALADLALRRLIYHGGRFALPLTGSRSALTHLAAALTPEEAAQQWRATLSQSELGLAALGGVPPRPWLEDWLARIPSGDATHPASGRPNGKPAPSAEAIGAAGGALRSEKTVLLVHRPGAEQTEVRVGHLAPSRSAAGWAARRVLNSVLGGKFTSRLNLRLREGDGSTYGASSALMERVDGGLFVARCSADNRFAARAVVGIVEEMQRLVEEQVEATELADARSYLLGVLPYRLQTLGGRSQQLQTQWLHRLSTERPRREIAELAAIDSTALLAAAAQVLRPDGAAVVLVGCQSELAPQLEQLAVSGFHCQVLPSPEPLFAAGELTTAPATAPS